MVATDAEALVLLAMVPLGQLLPQPVASARALAEPGTDWLERVAVERQRLRRCWACLARKCRELHQ